MVGERRQPSLDRLARFGVRPKRDLGQNFLIDGNLLDVIGREAELRPDDVVVEVGGGLGVLTEYLAERVSFVHVLEVDPALESALRDAVGARRNVAIKIADAARADLASLDPEPNKMVANLPYGVAVPVLVRSVIEAPQLAAWVVMVQREIADRLLAKPGGRDYGAPSAIVRLACEVRFLRPVSRTVFVPRPRVDSALIAMARRRPFPDPRLRLLVAGAFAHRRKALARSLAIACADEPALAAAYGREPERVREAAREAVAAMGLPADVRAERLSPEQFEALAARLQVEPGTGGR